MTKYFLATLFCLISLATFAQDSPIGLWKTIDDNTGEAKAHIEIFEQGGKLHGKIVKLLSSPADSVCEECPGEKKNKKLVGMEIVWDLEKDGSEWNSGKIMDPENGKVYKCLISIEDSETLRVRGYIGFSALGRNQYWKRV